MAGLLAAGWNGSNIVAAAPPISAATDGVVSRPLEPARGGAAGATLFAARDLKSAGVDFVHRWTPPAKYADLLKKETPGGRVAVGDFDGDDKPDLFLTRPFGGSQLYRNLGDWKFENATVAAGLGKDEAWGTGATFADVNGDGSLDLFVCSYDAPNRLYLNDGKGHLRETAREAGLDFSGSSVMMAFADIDGDGDLDGYLLTNRLHAVPGIPEMPEDARKSLRRQGDTFTMDPMLKEFWDVLSFTPGEFMVSPAGQYDRLYRNDGAGADGVPKFTDITQVAGVMDNGQGLSATWWDYDNDGDADLYVANDFFWPDHLYRNNGDSTFTDVAPELLPHTPWFSMGSDVGDLNNDGWLDFMASDMAGSNHYKDKMGMGDMDRNVAFLEQPVPRQYMRNAVYLNSGGGGAFMECAHLLRVAGTDWTWSLRFADFDCDGWTDLYVTNGMTGDFMNSDLVAEANLKGKTVEEAPLKKDVNMAFRNLGDLKFENAGKAWGLDLAAVSFGAALGDLDGDGDVDILVNNFDGAPSLYENTGVEGGRLSIRLQGAAGKNTWGIGARVVAEAGAQKMSRYLTLSHGFASCDEPLVNFGLGGAAQVDRLTIYWPGGPEQTLTAIRVGQRLTISQPEGPKPMLARQPAPLFTASASLAGASHSERLYDDFARQPLLQNQSSQLGPGLAWGDVDGDGDDDLFFGRGAGSAGYLVFNQGAATAGGDVKFAVNSFAPFDADAAAEDLGALFFDADADGDADLYVVSGGVECEPGDAVLQDRLYLNDGKGTFTKAPPGTLPDEKESGSCVVAADFDRDGDLDLLVGGRIVPGQYPLAPPSRLLDNVKGKFTDVTKTKAPALLEAGMVTGAVWSDADNDGWVDLIVVSEWGAPQLLLNKQGKLVAEPSAMGGPEMSGWWNSVDAADLDEDGDMDYVVGNFGLNTKYHPSSEHPVKMFYADFDGTGKPQVVEAKENSEGELLPVRGKSCSQAAMPFLKKKFPLFRDFASASLQSIYSDEKLKAARQFQVQTLDTGVLWNETKPSGIKFTFAPLPRLAQIAPVFGQALADFDGDGHLDIVLAQNFYSPQRETGRMDGGLGVMLKGDGKRGFVTVWPDASGLRIKADAKSLTVTDLNGDQRPDLVFGINDGELQRYNSTPPAGTGKAFALRLVGPMGNTSAAGARVSLKTSARRTLSGEIHLGGGYLSQSQPWFSLPLSEGETAVEISIRWPDGKSSSHAAAELPGAKAGGALLIRQP
jgi:enediyne biosynthesis protein E4